MLPTLLDLAKGAFKKENIVESPTTALSAIGTLSGGAGLMTYSTTEEAILAAIVTGFSVCMFFINERKDA